MLGVPNYCSLESYVDDSKLHLSFLVKDIDGAAQQITEDRQMLQNMPTDLQVHVTLLGEELR